MTERTRIVTASYEHYKVTHSQHPNALRKRVRNLARRLRNTPNESASKYLARALGVYLEQEPKAGYSDTLPDGVNLALRTLKIATADNCRGIDADQVKKVAELLEREARRDDNPAVICAILHLEDTCRELLEKPQKTAENANCVQSAHRENNAGKEYVDNKMPSYHYYQELFQKKPEDLQRQVQMMGKIILGYRSEHKDNPALKYSIHILNTYLGGTKSLDQMPQELAYQVRRKKGMQLYESPEAAVSVKWLWEMAEGRITDADRVCGILYLRDLYLSLLKGETSDHPTIQKLSKLAEDLKQWAKDALLAQKRESVLALAERLIALSKSDKKEDFSKFIHEIIALAVYTNDWPYENHEEAAQKVVEAQAFYRKFRNGTARAALELRMGAMVEKLCKIAQRDSLYDLDHVLFLYKNPCARDEKKASSAEDVEIDLRGLSKMVEQQIDHGIDGDLSDIHSMDAARELDPEDKKMAAKTPFPNVKNQAFDRVRQSASHC